MPNKVFPVVSVLGLEASSKFARLFDVYNATVGQCFGLFIRTYHEWL